MKKHWKAIARTSHLTLYVTTADHGATTTNQENRRVAIELDTAHRHLALEAFGNYVVSRGLRLAGPPHDIDSIPQDLYQVASLSEFPSAESPYSITATVYQDGKRE